MRLSNIKYNPYYKNQSNNIVAFKQDKKIAENNELKKYEKFLEEKLLFANSFDANADWKATKQTINHLIAENSYTSFFGTQICPNKSEIIERETAYFNAKAQKAKHIKKHQNFITIILKLIKKEIEQQENSKEEVKTTKTNKSNKKEPKSQNTNNSIKEALSALYAEKAAFYKEHPLPQKEDLQTILALNKKESELIKLAKKANVSILQKREFSSDPEVDKDKKYNYIFKTVLPNMHINEATALDALEMFEKYGDRMLGPDATCKNDMFENSLHQMAMNISHCVSDVNHSPELFDRFLDVFKKFAQKDAVYFRDNESLELMFINCDKMTPKQVADYIDVLSSIAIHKADLQFVKNHINTDTFPHKDNPIVTEALDRLADAVKDLPDNVPFKSIK